VFGIVALTLRVGLRNASTTGRLLCHSSIIAEALLEHGKGHQEDNPD
jgi:hypothetical protein